MLRMVSFGLDWHWRQQTGQADQGSTPSNAVLDVSALASVVFAAGEKQQGHGQLLMRQIPNDYRKRVSTPLPEEDYSFVNYLSYALYPPLYIAGPIITFNDFVWQVSHLTRRFACISLVVQILPSPVNA
jgi:hypothetical protein